MSGLRPPSLPALPCDAFPAVPGKVGERGSQVRGAPKQRKRRGWCAEGGAGVYGAAGPPAAVATATAAAILGPYCTGSRCGHVTAPARPSLLYAAGRANVRARPRLPRGAARRTSRRSAASRHSPALPLSAYPLEHAREGGPTLKCVERPVLTPTAKICLRKRNLIRPGRLIERILTACRAPWWL